MSLWLRKSGKKGQWFYLAVELPLPILLTAIGIAVAVVFGFTSSAPIATLLACLSIAVAGSLLVAMAKWSLFRQRGFISFGSTGMSGGMKALYRLGWFLIILGAVLVALVVAILSRQA